MRKAKMNRLFALIGRDGITDRHAWATERLGRAHNPVTTFRDLTEDEIGRLISAAEYPLLDDDPACGEPGCIGHDPDGWCVREDGETCLSRVGA